MKRQSCATEASARASETETLLPCFFGALRGMSFHDFDQAGTWTHSELQLPFERRDRVERIGGALMDRRKVRVSPKDADPA
jgi:hypothetical protein